MVTNRVGCWELKIIVLFAKQPVRFPSGVSVNETTQATSTFRRFAEPFMTINSSCPFRHTSRAGPNQIPLYKHNKRVSERRKTRRARSYETTRRRPARGGLSRSDNANRRAVSPGRASRRRPRTAHRGHRVGDGFMHQLRTIDDVLDVNYTQGQCRHVGSWG